VTGKAVADVPEAISIRWFFFGEAMHINQVVYNSLAIIKEQLEEGISNNFEPEVSKKLDFIQKWLDDSELTIAIPKKITKEWYGEVYLISDHWQKLRHKALEYSKGLCQLCNSDKLINVHHRTYENLGYENIKDLIVLCKLCHAKFHNIGELKNETAR
jgi:hypothetical protein